jgi:hypothetical protein
MGFFNDKKIDLNNLHFEWMRQVDLSHQYGMDLAEARKGVEKAQEAVKVEEAQAGDRVRLKLAELNVKFTVDMVRDGVVLDEKLRQQKEVLIDALYNKDVINAGFTAIQDKKKALEGLVDLLRMEYWAVPVEPKEYENWKGAKLLNESRQKAEKEVHESATNSRRRSANPNSK